MRSLLTGILLFSVLVMNFQTLTTVAWFLYNQDFIADVLCINKEKPTLHCEGKCFLMEKLAAQQPSNDHEPQIPGGEERPVFLFYNGYETGNLSSMNALYRIDLPAFDAAFLSADFYKGLFRPPKC